MKLPVVPVLLLVNLALALAIAWLWADPARYTWVAPAALAPDAGTLTVDAPAPEAIDLARYRETVDRPLFAPDRRPPAHSVASAESGPAATDPFADLRLFALFDAGQGREGAIVATGGVTRRVRAGDKVGDWTLEGVDGREAIFVNGDETRTVALPRALLPGAAAADASSASAQPGEAQPAPPQRTEAPPPGAGARSARDRVRERIARNNVHRIQNGLPPEPLPE